MMPKYWSRFTKLVAGVFAALGLAMPAMSQESIEERLQKLEKQNEELRKQLNQLPAVPTSTSETPLRPDDVRQIVTQFIETKEKEKKAEPAAAKKDSWYEVGSDLKMAASWRNGVWIETANKDFQLHLGARLQQDVFGTSLQSNVANSIGRSNFEDGTFARRMRLFVEGTAYEICEWNFELDLENSSFGKGTANGDRTVVPTTAPAAGGALTPANTGTNTTAILFDDFWFGLKELPLIGNVRVGNVRIPQGLECYSSSRWLNFMERGSNFDAFEIEFAPGIWAFNGFFDNRLNLAGSVTRFNDQQDLMSLSSGQTWQTTGRVAALPIYQNDGRCLLHLAGSYAHRGGVFNVADNAYEATFQSRAPVSDRAAHATLDQPGAIIANDIHIAGAEFLWINGAFNVQSEFTYTSAQGARQPTTGAKTLRGDDNMTAWYVSCGYFLTGEHRGYDKRRAVLDRTKINENFFFTKGEDGRYCFGHGAWEIALRYDQIDLLDSGIGTNGQGVMRDYTVGLNWYLNNNMKVQFNYVAADRTVLNSPQTSGFVHYIGTRFHFDF